MNKLMMLLAKQILLHQSDGISKVRFAKTIYLVYKGLILQDVLDTQQIAFIRMPLGPVPDDFGMLEKDADIKVTCLSTGLSYNKQNYSLVSKNVEKQDYYDRITKLLDGLKNMATNYMVKYTHQEPSWINNTNGSVYYINSQDLNRALPHPLSSLDTSDDEQKLQGLLLSGMIDDIVAESTALEYPEEVVPFSEENG